MTLNQPFSAATEVARRVWALNPGDTSVPEEAAAAVDRVCAQLRAGLGRWVGFEGYRALLVRALERVRAEHPALNNLSCVGGDEPEIVAAVQAHGAAAVTAGVVALVVTMIELLGRVVGEEMAAELVKQAAMVSPRRGSNNEISGGGDG
jgi:hypothetical protein